MIRKIKTHLSGLRAVVRYEGWKSLISRGFDYLAHRICVFDKYYTVCLDPKITAQAKEADFVPKTDNYCWKMLSTIDEADELASDGFDFGAYEINLRASLDYDVIVFCIFINKELAHIVCLADNLKGKKNIDFRPFNVDFNNAEIATGKVLTIPKFRRLHLRTYSGFLVRRYCLERDINLIKGTVGEYNATLVSAAQDGYLTILSKCRYTKIFCFKHLKEEKFKPVKSKQLMEQKQGYLNKIIQKINK